MTKTRSLRSASCRIHYRLPMSDLKCWRAKPGKGDYPNTVISSQGRQTNWVQEKHSLLQFIAVSRLASGRAGWLVLTCRRRFSCGLRGKLWGTNVSR
jgi:hypothetical protein